MTLASYYRVAAARLGQTAQDDSFDGTIQIILSSYQGEVLERLTRQYEQEMPQKAPDFYHGIIWMARLSGIFAFDWKLAIIAISAQSQAAIEILERRIAAG